MFVANLLNETESPAERNTLVVICTALTVLLVIGMNERMNETKRNEVIDQYIDMDLSTAMCANMHTHTFT